MPTPPRKEVHFYVDDSGSRDPDRKRDGKNRSDVDWFGLGGFLIHAENKVAAEEQIANFRSQWPELGDTPLHSYDIRNRTNSFRWLEPDAEKRLRFYKGLSRLICGLPVVVHACVVDRPGYNRRYMQQYGPRRWRLCRTAFNIMVERAAKYAKLHDARLRVFVEQSDKRTEEQFKSYFNDARTAGLPFDPARSQKYTPLTADELRDTLFEFGVRTKASLLMQIADLVLWPVCVGGYFPDNPNLIELRLAGKLLDLHCTDRNGLHGIKYSCFDACAANHSTPEIQKPAEAGSCRPPNFG